MGGDGVTLCNTTTGDVFECDSWMDSVPSEMDINLIAHHLYWNKGDMLISIRDGGHYFEHTYDEDSDSVVTKYLDTDVSVSTGASVDTEAPVGSEDTKVTNKTSFSCNYFAEDDKSSNANMVTCTRYLDGKKYVTRQLFKYSRMKHNHFPQWHEFGNTKVCTHCLFKLSLSANGNTTIKLTQCDTYSCSLKSEPEVTLDNLDELLSSNLPVYFNGGLLKTATERDHYLIIAGADSLTYSYDRRVTYDNRQLEDELREKIKNLLTKYSITRGSQLYRSVLNEFTVWLGGGDEESTEVWLGGGDKKSSPATITKTAEAVACC